MDTDLKKTVGQKLQLLRLDKNLTQDQMSEKLNLSTSAYCKIEYGETDLTLTRLNKIAEVLNISPIELFNKINGDNDFHQPENCNSVSIAQENPMSTHSSNDLRELIKANSRMIDMLYKRIDILEKETRHNL